LHPKAGKLNQFSGLCLDNDIAVLNQRLCCKKKKKGNHPEIQFFPSPFSKKRKRKSQHNRREQIYKKQDKDKKLKAHFREETSFSCLNILTTTTISLLVKG